MRNYLNFSPIIYWPRSIQLCCFAAGYILLCLILYLLINLPLKTLLRHNALLITGLTQEFNDKQKLISAEKSSVQNKEIATNSIEPHKLQPERLSHLLTQLVTLASETHLEFDTIKPLPKEITHNLQIQPIQLSTTGHYQQIIDFFSQLAQLASISTLGDFNIKPLSTPTQANTPEKNLQLTLILNFYSKANPS